MDILKVATWLKICCNNRPTHGNWANYTAIEQKEKSPKKDAVKNENKKHGIKGKEKSPKADAVKDENTKHDKKEKKKSSKADAVKDKNKKHGNKEKEKSPKADAVKDENTKHDSKERKTKSNKKNARKVRQISIELSEIFFVDFDKIIGNNTILTTGKKEKISSKKDRHGRWSGRGIPG